jgi:hypothetical protein
VISHTFLIVAHTTIIIICSHFYQELTPFEKYFSVSKRYSYEVKSDRKHRIHPSICPHPLSLLKPKSRKIMNLVPVKLLIRLGLHNANSYLKVIFPCMELQLIPVYSAQRPPLWSSGQSSWLQIRRPGFDSRHYQKKSGSGTGSTQPREYNWGATW